VDDDRQAAAAGGEVRGSGDVAPEADHDLGPHAVEHLAGCPYRIAQPAEHRAVGEYAASRADVVAAVGEAARPIADGAGERAVALADNDAAVDWLRGQLAAGDVALVKASREARLDEVAAALA
jgi:hypothetical protein